MTMDNEKRVTTYRDAMNRYKEDLEKTVKMVLDTGLSTGHADSFPKLMEKVLSQMKELQNQLSGLKEDVSRRWDHD